MLVARQHPQTDAEIAFGREIAWCPSPLARNARSWLASYFAGLVKENSPCRHQRILLLSDGVITTTHGCCHAVERSHRTTDEAARPHVLVTVMQAGSMGKAAQRLNISQPAVSRSIAELEHALGVRLLDRQHQGVEPTEYGRALLECGVAAFDELRQGVKNIEFLADPATGETRVGGNPFLATTFACMTIDRLFRCYPRTVIHLTAGPEQDLYRKLRDRSLDLVITRRFGPIDERFEFEFLLDDSPFLVVAGVRSPWA